MGNSLGGSRDTNGFRLGVASGMLPSVDSITFTGKFNESYFPLPRRASDGDSEAPLLDLVAQPAVVDGSPHVAAFLTCSRDGDRTRHRPMEMSIAIDVSGSMTDLMGEIKTEEDLFTARSKLDVARNAVGGLVGALTHAEDTVSVVSFAEAATVVHPMSRVADTAEGAVREAVNGMAWGGGTRLMAGFRAALAQLGCDLDKPAAERAATDAVEPERRIVFLTDMRDSSEDAGGVVELSAAVEAAAARGVHVTFVGVGVDFLSGVAESVTNMDVPGANYFTVLSEDDFARVMQEEFAFSFFPAAFDVKVDVEGEGWRVADVWGTPPTAGPAEPAVGADVSDKGVDERPEGGCVMRAGTVFPSAVAPVPVAGDAAGGATMTKGGLLLLKLQHDDAGSGDTATAGAGEAREPVRLVVSYVDAMRPHGGRVTMEVPVEVRSRVLGTAARAKEDSKGATGAAAEGKAPEADGTVEESTVANDVYASPTVRKAVLLQRFVSVTRAFLAAHHAATAPEKPADAAPLERWEAAKRALADFLPIMRDGYAKLGDTCGDSGSMAADLATLERWAATHCPALSAGADADPALSAPSGEAATM